MRRAEFVASLLLLVVAGLYIWGAGKVPYGKWSAPGAGFLPFWEGVLLAIGAGALVIKVLREERSPSVDWPRGEARRMVFRLWVVLAGYVILIPWLGYVLSTMLFLVLITRSWRQHSWRVVAFWGAGLSVALYTIFVVLLKIPLPSSPFGLP